MATRTSSPPRSRSSKSSRSGSSGSQSRRTSSTRKRGSSRSRSRSSSAGRRGPGLLTVLVTGIGRALRAIWLGIAHVLGAVVRSIGSTARDLDPEHRRDGLGLLLVGLAVVVSAAVWWRLPGEVGDVLRAVVEGSVGIAAYAVPLLLLLAAWRFMRNPERTGPAGRPIIGWTAMALGILGLIHIQH